MLSKSWRLSIVPALLLMLSPALCSAQISVSVSVAPPELPVYDQPPIPDDGYIWTPGYWAWGDDIQDYYWVPGTWVEAPQPEYLWTPGYWGAEGAVFIWHAGYWGPQVGFYGGVNYGYGYGGRGYEGGYWQGGHLFYNRAVVNIGSTHITNVYNETVVNNISVTRVSFNGGNGGVRAAPNSQEMAAARERHIEATPVQREHLQTARTNPELRAGSNHGHPPIAATPRAGNFSNPVPARNAVTPTRNATVGAEGQNPAERQTPQPRLSTPRPATEARPIQPNRETAAPQERAVPPQHASPPPREAPPPREVPPPRQAAPPPREAPPPHEAPPPRQAAPVEPRREPAQTQGVKPAPKPQEHAAPPPPEPKEHPDDHEHH
jgi:WXXGXW repeat (2 copies)